MRDIEIINEELRLKDEEQLSAVIEKLGRTVLRGDKKDKAEYVRAIIIMFIHYLLTFSIDYLLTFSIDYLLTFSIDC